MAAITMLNPKAELARASQALAINIAAARGLQDVMKSNLGPCGTMKMLVSGSGDVKITKDGHTLLKEMQIQHPTTSLIARASTAIDDVVGDGSTSTVLLIAELLKQAEYFLSEGIHPRVILEGFEIAKKECLKIMNELKIKTGGSVESVYGACYTSLCTKILDKKFCPYLADLLTKAVKHIHDPRKPLDLHMIEIMTMQHQSAEETTLINGLVLDHGSRHPAMPKKLENAYILICNVSLEYEKTEVNSGFFYKTAAEREKLVESEKAFIKERVMKLIELKKKVCDGTDKTFVVINQKGIDPTSLDLLARENIMGLRRAKRRNMERLSLATGGIAVNSFDDLTKDVLGEAGLVYEHVLGENKYTFVEECKCSQSVTILIKGPNTYTIGLIKEAVYDGLRAIKNGMEDNHVLPGAGAFEIHASSKLEELSKKTQGRAQFGIKAFSEALLIIPKVLFANAGKDPLTTIAKINDIRKEDGSGQPYGYDLVSDEPVNSKLKEIHDGFCVKKQMIDTATVIASNLLLVDEIMRAGLSSLGGN